MFNYECDYSEGNSLQTCKQEIEKSPIIPRISARLFREGKQFGVRRRSAAFCYNRGHLSLANLCRRRRTQRITATRACLSADAAGRAMPADNLVLGCHNAFHLHFLQARNARQHAYRV